jgi:hypothetical protein
MNMNLSRLIALVPALAPMVVLANECTVRSDPQARVLVELYTSEGCSSCPPADHWISDLAARGDKRVVPIAFHVTYWDYIGWKDRFADRRYTDRQRDIAKAQDSEMVYTPQVIVGGRDFRRWAIKSDLEKAIEEISASAAPTTIAITSKPSGDHGIEGSASLKPAGKNVELYVALTQDGLSSKVTRGENRGETLNHNAVVRDFAEIGSSDGSFHFKPASDWDLAHMSIVAFAQDTRTGRVLQAVSAPLCR